MKTINQEEFTQRFLQYCLTLRKVPTDKLFETFLKELKTSEDEKSSSINLTESEKKFIHARKLWTDIVSYVGNKEVTQSSKLMQRLTNLFGKISQKEYANYIDYVKNYSTVVLSFNASFLNNGLTDFQLLNIFESSKIKPTQYLINRIQTEEALSKNLDPTLKEQLKNNLHAKPRYAALILHDRNHIIEPIHNYGQSFIVFNDIVKFNCLFNAYDSMDAKINYATDLSPSTFHTLDNLLAQCGDNFLTALMDRVTTGRLPINYSPQYPTKISKDSYIEVMLPPINIFDKNLVQHIHFHEDEFKPSASDLDFTKKRGITVTCGKKSPYSDLCSQFMQAVEANNLADVKSLLALYPSLAIITNFFAEAPIHIAAKKGYTEMVKSFIRSGTNINFYQIPGGTTLHFAIREGHSETIKALVNMKGIHINASTNKLPFLTPLDVAITSEKISPEIFQYLLQRGAEPNLTSLIAAIPNTERFKILLQTQKIDIEAYDPHGMSVLHYAVIFGSAKLVEFLLSLPNINVNQKTKMGNFALHIAAKNGDAYFVKLLLQTRGILLEEKFEDTTAEEIARRNTYFLIGDLIKDKIDEKKFYEHIQQQTFENEKLTEDYLEITKKNNALPSLQGLEKFINALKAQIIELTIHNNPNLLSSFLQKYPTLLTTANEIGEELIHLAAKNGHLETVKLLSSYPVDINKLSKLGKAPLHYAVESCNLLLVQALTDLKNINLNIQTVKENVTLSGKTPAFIASYHQNTDRILMHLIQKGADTSIATANGQTPLTVAIWTRQTNRVKQLLQLTNLNINSIIYTGETALTNAVLKADSETVKSILALPGINILNHKTNQGESALFIAASHNKIATVKILLQMSGIDLEAKRTPGDGKTAFQIADEAGHFEISAMLQSAILKKQFGKANSKDKLLDLVSTIFEKHMQAVEENDSMIRIRELFKDLRKVNEEKFLLEIILGCIFLEKNKEDTKLKTKWFKWQSVTLYQKQLNNVINDFLKFLIPMGIDICHYTEKKSIASFQLYEMDYKPNSSYKP